jgi:hypothetical protein
MRIQRVNALVSVRTGDTDQSFGNEVYRCGDRAIPVTEIPILQSMNGPQSVRDISPFDFYETTQPEEHARLLKSYRAEIVTAIYPSPFSPLPTLIEHVELPPGELKANPFKGEVVLPEGNLADEDDMPFEVPAVAVAATIAALPDDKNELRAAIKALTGKAPFGNLSVEKLQALLAEAQKAAA